MSEQCGWKARYLDTGRWKECEEQTVFDDKFCPVHQEIALANEILVSSPIDLLATALLPIVEALKEGRIRIERYEDHWFPPTNAEDDNSGDKCTDGFRVIVTPKAGDGA